jgi:hypothetical protein
MFRLAPVISTESLAAVVCFFSVQGQPFAIDNSIQRGCRRIGQRD